MLLILSVGEMDAENVMWCFSICGSGLGVREDIYVCCCCEWVLFDRQVSARGAHEQHLSRVALNELKT